jgi:hypothetical protein
VLERGGAAIAGVEVKAGASDTDADFRGLRKLRAAAGQQFASGVVLYDGASATRFGENLFAVPLRILGEGRRHERPRTQERHRDEGDDTNWHHPELNGHKPTAISLR